MRPEVSIIVVTHDAPRYLFKLFRSLPRTENVRYEVVVVDNRSRTPVRLILAGLAVLGRISRLCLLDRNTLFAEGNNVGVAASSRSAPLVLLLNSDVEVRDAGWLRRLIDAHARGVTSLGAVELGPLPRADGYCLLVDRDLYLSAGGLDEGFQWYWGVTKLQAEVLAGGHPVRAVREHDELLHHFGGKSSGGVEGAAGMETTPDTVRSWFSGRTVEVLERLP